MELKLKGIPAIIAVVVIVAGDIMADTKAMKDAIERGDNETAYS